MAAGEGDGTGHRSAGLGNGRSAEDAVPASAEGGENTFGGVTTTLWGSLIALAGLLTALGMNSDRLFVALNNHTGLTLVAPALAITAVGLSLYAYFTHQRLLLIVGSTAYIAALVASLVVATLAASGNGRPTVTSVSLTGQRPQVSLTFTVQAVGVDRNDHVAAFVRLLHAREGDRTDTELYSGSLRSDDMGKVDQKVTIPLTVPRNATHVTINVTNSGDKGKSHCTTRSPTAPACVTVNLP
ncbi:hypothetical protein SSP24_76630 [Streptomyces spinoverrucosus]|uniref:Uncharacterized protein n=1 Tax=Streptomyces spinoverrucosus TaxID=284043 RepID=A0A4Y3VUT5_9ACTN|nr:hypothetical protein [Streptomyces spinoverrucosus]GEC10008.1 hypothetical protein SSP24_76630 [Streptomyces spinoverrucosus]GHB75187.1 hypothetical protein GCM10010397_51930 [Streptomyces spinoverrucosus]